MCAMSSRLNHNIFCIMSCKALILISRVSVKNVLSLCRLSPCGSGPYLFLSLIKNMSSINDPRDQALLWVSLEMI